jgi:hypothetical protein
MSIEEVVGGVRSMASGDAMVRRGGRRAGPEGQSYQGEMGGGKRPRGQKPAAGEANREEDHGKEENAGHMLSLTHD